MSEKRAHLERIAALCKIQFTEEEMQKFEKEFDSILNFINQIRDAKVGETGEFETVLEIDDLRPDIARESLPTATVLANTKHKRNNFFVVPQVVE